MRRFAVLLFLLPLFAKGQLLQSTNGLTADSIANIYFDSQKETLPIHNGRVFYGYPGVLGTAIFPSNDWQKGSLLFDGVWYHSVTMMYDTYPGDLILLHPGSTPIILFNERIEQFNFGGLKFVRLTTDKDNVVKSAIYQLLVEGNATVFVRRSKKIVENIVDLRVERRFVTADEYFIFKNGHYYPVKKQKTLLNLLKDGREDIVKHLKSRGIKFKHDKEKAIVAITQYYNQLHK